VKLIFRSLIFLLATGMVLGANPCMAETDDPASRILRANDFYHEKDYGKAAKIYEGLIDQGYRNGHLYYNLGNAYIRLGKNGKAILNYLHAKRFLPRDKDLEANLKYASQETVDALDWKKPGLIATFFFWADDFNFQEHLSILTVINLMFWISMGAWLFKKTETMDLIRKSLIAVLALALVSTMVKWHLDTSHHLGVVLAKKIAVKSGMDQDNVTLFELHEGAVVFIEQEEKDWYKIELSDGKHGWAKKSVIGA